MNWGDLMAFRILAQELSFTRAAARLHITQPALSVRIRRLEQALGARLLDRNTRVVHLTGPGSLLSAWVDHAARSWEQIQEMVADPEGYRGPYRPEVSGDGPGGRGPADGVAPLGDGTTGQRRRAAGQPVEQSGTDRPATVNQVPYRGRTNECRSTAVL